MNKENSGPRRQTATCSLCRRKHSSTRCPTCAGRLEKAAELGLSRIETMDLLFTGQLPKERA